MKRVFIILAFLFFSLFSLNAVELTFKLTPSGSFPFLTSGNNKFDVLGGNVSFQGGVNIFDWLNIGPEFSYTILPKESSKDLPDGASKFLSMMAVGLHFGALLYPASRLELELGVALGPYLSVQKEREHSAPWYKAFADVAFRLTPNWTLGAEAAWIDFQDTTYWGNSGAAGINVGVSVRYKFDTEKSSQNVDGTVTQDDSVFPLLYTLYKENPFATITIKNDETAEIRNVKVSFRAGKYTSSELECGTLDLIKKHKTAELPLSADFSSEILNFTEEGKIPGELVIEYTLLGQKRTAISQVIIPVFNRNQIRWTDPSMLASFISPTAPEILEYSKVLVGLARSHLRSGLNKNLQYAIFVFEGMRLSGINCKADETTPYDVFHTDFESRDYIQYPYQTMLYKAGDKDDLGILFMSLLQSTGIDTAFIPASEDFIVAFNLKLSSSKVNSLFDGSDRILDIDDEIWIPVSMASIKEGFVNSWYKAIEELNEMKENEEDIEFYAISEAWKSYPSAGFSGGEDFNILPNEKTLISAAETNLSRYITAEFGPQIAAVQEMIKQQGLSVKSLNQLGMLYVRAGMYSSAAKVFEKSASMGSTTAMVNLGNIASLQKKYVEAKQWFEKVLEIAPDNKTAKKNLESILRELDE